MSQLALVDAVGVTRQTVIAIEKGRYSPSPERAFRISHVSVVGLEDVFGWEERRLCILLRFAFFSATEIMLASVQLFLICSSLAVDQNR